MIRHNHPDLRGSFTCLGCWFNILHKESMDECTEMLRQVTSQRDLRTAAQEIEEARHAAEVWEPKPHMQWFYDKYLEENS